MKPHYIVATLKPWNIDAFYQNVGKMKGCWHIAQTPAELDALLQHIQPKFIFFPHWSWLVPDSVVQNNDCVCLHMSDVPYGRGGSPLQNLIVRGHKNTKLTALKMTAELDSGPVYLKTDLSLEGNAQKIYERAAKKTYELIAYIVENEPDPIAQKGNAVLFKRRAPEQSCLPIDGSIEKIYDHIRMLDAKTYPKAFIQHGQFNIVFENAHIQEQHVEAKVIIQREVS